MRKPSRARSLAVLVAGGIAVTWATVGYPQAAAVAQAPAIAQAKSAAPAAASTRAMLDRYCVSCHNEKLKTAGLMLDAAALTNLTKDGELWEKVIRKLRAGAMPPPGAPRPQPDISDAVATYLETELDRGASDRPNPGYIGPFHRLSRTEYQNAIRDLLALDVLPKELDITTMLLPDNSSSGFDNLADLLFVSPTALEGYLSAARKISRVAIGDPAVPVLVDRYTLPDDLPQDIRQDGAPVGTRGGIVIATYLPVDGEYRLTIELAGAARERHELEVSVDGARAQLVTLGDKPAESRPPGTGPAVAKPLEVVLPLQAGPRTISIAFVEHTHALREDLVRPRMRTRGNQPALASVTLGGPMKVAGSGDTPSRRRVFVCHPASRSQELSCAREILSTLTRRAYRRPSTAQDVELLLPFYERGRAEGSFDQGIQRALERVLVSPQFLFRIERTPASGAMARVSDLELASRLSFFLWSSIPDDELLDVTIRGKLRQPGELERQVRRMLADVRSKSLVTNFAAQWLYLKDVQAKRPDALVFPDFDASLQRAFTRETELFLESMFREDHGALDLLTADYTFVNERLAKHYGIPNVYGTDFRRVTLTDDYRRGLLGHGSILLLTSYSTRTSPVLRGKYVLGNLFGTPPPPPPANVPSLKTENQSTGKALSMREAMVAHRANPVCASCHTRMDPIGFALDNFDAVGRWRTVAESGAPIDPSGVLPDGSKFDGVVGLRNLLVSRPQPFIGTLTENLLTYALGRSIAYYDAPVIRAIVRNAAPDNFRFSSLILGIVKSTPFQMRAAEPPPAGTVASQP